MNTIQEGKILLKVFNQEHKDKISKELPVFYNPVMKLNRDLSILLINSLKEEDFQIAMPMAGSGVRGIRFIQELKQNKIRNISFNDYSKDSIDLIKDNMKLNGLKWKRLKKLKLIDINEKDANEFLLESKGFNYIDIDPFGPPIQFLDAAVKRISRNGILAVTATDTSALSGTYPKACKRKYWATPKRDSIMHETGIRILARRVQLIGLSQDKALTPVFSYSKDHYMRVFFRCEKSKEKCDVIFKQQGVFNEAGPMWLGQLWDENLCKKMKEENTDEKNQKLLNTIHEESKINKLGFYDIYDLCKTNKLSIPKFETLFEVLKNKKFKVCRTHFSDKGIRSDVEKEELIKILKKL
ncbi:tRNA (guanine(26)-N(2))-dimethyltransferase [Candidatus Woesearchaeota archaeon]|nr:tRNA (guanine(26)-N(2))-dimethyltransferase [Candidatus Woesearchaeota archaeon]